MFTVRNLSAIMGELGSYQFLRYTDRIDSLVPIETDLKGRGYRYYDLAVCAYDKASKDVVLIE